MLSLLIFLSVCELVAGFPTLPIGHPIHLVSQKADNNEFDPTDLSFITRLAAIGDSYSAGIGAGKRLGSILDALNSQGGEFPIISVTLLAISASRTKSYLIDWACSRYDHAYPYLVNSDPSLGDPSKRTFQFLSCSGALSKDVLEKQIPRLSSDQQVILLSVGMYDVRSRK